MQPLRLEPQVLVEPVDVDETDRGAAACRVCRRELGEVHREECFIPQRLHEVEVAVRVVLPMPRAWERRIIEAYVALDHWRAWAHWPQLHPRLARPLALRYVGEAEPAVVQAVVDADRSAPSLPAGGGLLPWSEPSDIPFQTRADLDAHRARCGECAAPGSPGIAMHPDCGGDRPVHIRYADGVLLLICQCGAPVCALSIE